MIFGGLFTYWFYGRIRTTREYALLHLVERITAKELTTRLLESELKDIIRERDEIVKDRFDHVIEDAIVIDIDKPLQLEEFFEIMSRTMSKKFNIDERIILDLIHSREKESSTAISPTLAIPHIIIDGFGIFDIFLVRCKGGVRFSEASPKVHAVFVLMGTRDERNFHLRALAAIAQIVQASNFDDKWMSARNEKDLKDIILLGERKRYS